MSEVGRRTVGAIVFLAAGGVLFLALWLSPNPSGIGTHQQLGLPACNWVANFDLPCPTCGMTTSFSHAVRGEFLGSIRAQPAGFLLSILTACTLLIGLYVMATGSRVGSVLDRLWGRRAVWLLVASLVAAWAYKILHFREVI